MGEQWAGGNIEGATAPEVVEANVVEQASHEQHVAVPQLDLLLRHVVALRHGATTKVRGGA